MTRVSDIVRRGHTPMTNQQLADMALREDQEARRLRKLGRDAEADEHQAWADELAALLN